MLGFRYHPKQSLNPDDDYVKSKNLKGLFESLKSAREVLDDLASLEVIEVMTEAQRLSSHPSFAFKPPTSSNWMLMKLFTKNQV